MKKLIVVLIVGFIGNAFAGGDPYITATETYDATVKQTSTSKITWITVDDVPSACRKKSEEFGVKNNFINPRACSFHTKEYCVVITSKKPILGSLEHEIRHCFQGEWH